MANGWGASQTGGTWSVLGSTSRYGVTNGIGSHVLATPGTTAESVLTSVSAGDVDLRTTMAWSRSASSGTLYGTVVARRQTNGNDYRAKVVAATSGSVQLVLARKVGTTETSLRAVGVPGITLAANEQYRIAFRVVTSGASTNLSAKLWKIGTPEPATWSGNGNRQHRGTAGGRVGRREHLRIERRHLRCHRPDRRFPRRQAGRPLGDRLGQQLGERQCRGSPRSTSRWSRRTAPTEPARCSPAAVSLPVSDHALGSELELFHTFVLSWVVPVPDTCSLIVIFSPAATVRFGHDGTGEHGLGPPARAQQPDSHDPLPAIRHLAAVVALRRTPIVRSR